jgi:hypothetical protein
MDYFVLSAACRWHFLHVTKSQFLTHPHPVESVPVLFLGRSQPTHLPSSCVCHYRNMAASGMDAVLSRHVWESKAWRELKDHITDVDLVHLRELMDVRPCNFPLFRKIGTIRCCSFPLLQDRDRCGALVAEFEGIVVDYSRQRVLVETMVRVMRMLSPRALPPPLIFATLGLLYRRN